MIRPATKRLTELDALRGIAASLVMLFHYTTQYEKLFGHEKAPSIALPWGHYGVNLFFMISGFVIFMTLHRIRRPLDFIVSRFSRLFPAFWVAVVVTFLLTRWLELPGKTVDLGTALMNLFMIHGLARIPHVDSVYWTLEIELIFYAMALALFLAGRLDRVHSALLTLLSLQIIWSLSRQYLGIDLSWTVSHLLILPYIAWFVCGIMIYRLVYHPQETSSKDKLILIAAIVQLSIVDGIGIGFLALALSIALWMAATGRLPILANPILTWLGAISYTLYLLHENIGWAVILRLEHNGISGNLAILVAIAVTLLLAATLTRLIEKPAMNWIRTSYGNREWPRMGWRHASTMAGMFMVTFSGFAFAWHHSHPRPTKPQDYLERIFEPSDLEIVACPTNATPRPLIVLVLGQSNAGNHGETILSPQSSEPVTFFFKGHCYRSLGPAPGATGHGGNIWTLLGPRLSAATGHPIIFSVLAVESTRIRDWVEPGGLRNKLIETIETHRQYGFTPDLILWQQGEGDTLAGTTRAKYRQHFDALISLMRDHGISAPVLAALSTHCRGNASTTIRNALIEAAKSSSNVYIGPDTDRLTGAMRLDGCHFSAKGLQAAADLWLDTILTTIPAPISIN